MKISMRGNTKMLAIAMAEILEDLSFDALNESPDDCEEHGNYDDGKQHWRGGSRGKGGKIKYARR